MSTVEVNGVPLYYEVHGDGEPVLFVHGFPLSGQMWRGMVAPMGNKFKLIIPDLRGLGRSQVVSAVTMGDYADDLAGLLDAIGETRAVTLVGLSMGGYVAFEFFRRHANRLRAIGFIDTRAEGDAAAARSARETMAEEVRKRGSRVAADGMIDKLFGPGTSPEVRSKWREIMSGSDPAGVAAALLAMRDRADSVPTLEKIHLPTLVVVGVDDVITPIASARVIHEGIAGSQLKIVEGAGHMVPVEQPERFAEILTTFLRGLP